VSFPCQVSRLGLRGFANEGGALLPRHRQSHRTCRPALLMFENVAQIVGALHTANFNTVVDMVKAGYDASGGPLAALRPWGRHARGDRWFCVRQANQAADLQRPPRTHTCRLNGPRSAPPLILITVNYRPRHMMLGNAIVPPPRDWPSSAYTRRSKSLPLTFVEEGTTISYVPELGEGSAPGRSPQTRTCPGGRKRVYVHAAPTEPDKDWHASSWTQNTTSAPRSVDPARSTAWNAAHS
jgi:hypothetical protein